MAMQTRCTKSNIVGAFTLVWCIADEHGETGELPGLDAELLDYETGVAGFTAAAVAIGWIEDDAGTLRVARFDDHNSASAKRRSTEAKRSAARRRIPTKAPAATTPAGPPSPPATVPDMETLKPRLIAAGVTAPQVAINNAVAAGWTTPHAAAVLAVYESKRGAWTPYQLFERFRSAAAVAPAAGWPPVAAGWRRSDHLEGQAEAERQRRMAHAAEVKRDREQRRRLQTAS